MTDGIEEDPDDITWYQRLDSSIMLKIKGRGYVVLGDESYMGDDGHPYND